MRPHYGRPLIAFGGTLLVLIALILLAPGAVSTAAPVPTRTPSKRSSTVRTAEESWTTTGPFADDATAIVASPAFDSDRSVFLGVSYEINAGQPYVQAVAAILRSTDGGNTWAQVWSHQSAQGTTSAWLNQIVVSPNFASDGTIFALWAEGSSGAVIRSTDRGASFQAVNVPSSAFSPTTKTLSISPTFGADHTIAVTADSGTTAQSYLSTDGGSTWTLATPTAPDSCSDSINGGGFLLALGGTALGDYVPNASSVCANNLDQMFAYSSDGGTTWAKRGDLQAAAGNNNFDTQHSRMVAAPSGGAILYTDQYGNALRSADGGNTWTNLLTRGLGNDAPPNSASATGPYYNFEFRPPSSVYAVHEWYGATPRYFQSTDGGQSWTVGWQGNGATNLHGVFATDAQTIFFAPGDLGLIRSMDGGHTWQSIGQFQPQHNVVAVSPNYATDHSVFTVDFPAGVSEVGQDTAGYGTFRSTNAGATWSEPEASNPVSLQDQSGFATVFTTAQNGGLSLRVSPNYAHDHTVVEGDRIGTVNLSTDGGVHWTMSPIGNQVGWYIDSLALSPNYANDHAIYAGLGNLGYGVVKTTNAQTWSSDVPPDRFEEITQDQVRGLDASLEPSGLVDLAIGMGQLYLARDTPSSTTPPEWIATGSGAAYAVAMSPNYQQDCTIYIAQWPGPSGIGATLEDGVYVSNNACAANPPPQITWTWLTAGLPVRDFDTVVLSPNFKTDRTLYIGSYSSGVYVSHDGGKTWEALNTGLGNLVVHGLALAPTGPETAMLYAATNAGIWQIPVSLASGIAPRAFLPVIVEQTRQP